MNEAQTHTEAVPETGRNTEHYKVLALYFGFLVAILLQFPMQAMIQVVSFILFFALTSAIGFIRKEAERDSYIYNHATFLSRTLWMWSFLLTVGVILAGVYISSNVKIDLQDVAGLSKDLSAGHMDSPLLRRLIPIGIAAMAPSTVYVFARYVFGLMRAFRGQAVKRPKSFF